MDAPRKSDENQEDPAVHPVSGTVRLLRPGHPAFSRLLSFLPGEIAGDRTPLCPFCGAGTEDCTCGRHRRHFDRCASLFITRTLSKKGSSSSRNTGVRNPLLFSRSGWLRCSSGNGAAPTWTGSCRSRCARRKSGSGGHNQSRLLTKALSGYLNAPVSDVLVKIAAIRPQKELTALERGGNVLGAYDVREDALRNRALEGARLLLVDDVITTGATLDECAKVLKIAGAAEVLALTAARARLRSSNK